jgi:hypothetical protein
MVFNIYCTRHRIICCDRVQRFIADLPILPFNLDIVLVSFPGWVILVQRAFMSRDPFVFPEGLPIIIILLNVLPNFVVRKNLLEFVFTNEALELL